MSDFEDVVVVEDDMSLPEPTLASKGPASISYTASHGAVSDEEQSPEVWKATRKYPAFGCHQPEKTISLSNGEYVSVLEKHNSGTLCLKCLHTLGAHNPIRMVASTSLRSFCYGMGAVIIARTCSWGCSP